MGVNKAILLGNLGRDPELKYTPGGSALATFSLATTERYQGKDGQRQEKTEWHNVVVWGKRAEFVNQYLKKGRTVYIEGRITNRSWDGNDGVKKYRSEIVANVIEFAGGGRGDDSAGQSRDIPLPNPSDAPAMNHDDGGVDDDLPF